MFIILIIVQIKLFKIVVKKYIKIFIKYIKIIQKKFFVKLKFLFFILNISKIKYNKFYYSFASS